MFKLIKNKLSLLMAKTKVLWYINGPQTLPPPLTRAQEIEVFAALKRGEYPRKRKNDST